MYGRLSGRHAGSASAAFPARTVLSQVQGWGCWSREHPCTQLCRHSGDLEPESSRDILPGLLDASENEGSPGRWLVSVPAPR